MTENPIWCRLRTDSSEIRLLTIAPADDVQSPISCSLSLVSLDQKPDYEALSYTWGDVSELIPILLNGRQWPVKRNLADALGNFRLAQVHRIMFIDALCIDQENNAEKNIQVPLMGRIYRQASSVRCWLGPAFPGIERAIDMLRLHKVGLLADTLVSNAQTTTNGDIKALANLLKRAYWNRVWIVQEVALACSAVFHCGQYCFEWDMVSVISSVVNEIGLALQSIIHDFSLDVSQGSLMDIEELSHDIEELGNISARRLDPLVHVKTAVDDGKYLNGTELTVRAFSSRAATLPQDYIYGSLALLQPELRNMIVPDYNKDVALAYRDFALASMDFSGTPNLIHAAVRLQHTSYGLSSWVPDYSQEHIISASYFHSFMANDEIEPYFRLNERGLLEIGGSYVDEIVAHCPCDSQCGKIDLFERSLEYHERWRKFFRLPEIPDETNSNSSGYGTATLEYAYWATLARDRCCDPTTRQIYWLDSDTVDACKTWLRCLTQQPQPQIPEAIQCHVDNYHTSVTAMDATHLFRTQSGFMGVTHRSTPLKIGDHIFLFAGMSCPCILRPQSFQKDLVYKFVSTSYVHGAMLRRSEDENVLQSSSDLDYTNPLTTPADSWYRVLLD